MPNKQQRFKFIAHEILNSSISIVDSSEISKELNVEFKTSSGINEEGNKFRLEMHVVINDANENVSIDVTSYGYFEFDNELDNDTKDFFFNTSAPALLFPYVRAYISALTSLSGISAITLPTLNLTGGAIEE